MSFEYVYQKTAPATIEIQHTLLGTSGPYPILWKRDPTINLLQALRVGGICDHFLESTPQKSNIDRYLKYCFFQCISFQVRLFWVSMSLFGGVFCQILYRFIGKIKAIVTFWSGFSTINIQVLRQNAWGSSPQKVALQKRPQRIPLIKPSSKNRQN